VFLNIGLEGMMLGRRLHGLSSRPYTTGSFWLGFSRRRGGWGCAPRSSSCFLCIRKGLNQIVIGIAITVGGRRADLAAAFRASSAARIRAFRRGNRFLALPVLSKIPVLGKGLFSHNPLVYLGVNFSWLRSPGCFRSTYLGLSLEAAGNKPAALDAAGVDVVSRRARSPCCARVFLAGGRRRLHGETWVRVLFVPFITGGAGVIGIVSRDARARGGLFGC
jgi:ABC-type uncharacterized transport system permease subunit